MRLGARETAFTQQQRLTRRQEVIKGFKFIVFEASAGLVQFLVFTILFTGLALPYRWSYVPALVASVLWSFTANRKFTFKSVSNIPVAMVKVAFYYSLFTPLSTWIGGSLTDHSWGISDKAQGFIVLAGTMILNLVTEFCVYRFWVYRKSINTSTSGLREQERYANPYDDDSEISSLVNNLIQSAGEYDSAQGGRYGS